MFKRLAVFLLAVMFVVESGRLWESCFQSQTVDAAPLHLVGVAMLKQTTLKSPMGGPIETISMDDVMKNIVMAYPLPVFPATTAALQVRLAVYDNGVANAPM